VDVADFEEVAHGKWLKMVNGELVNGELVNGELVNGEW
jgi:hypothetical protein